MARVNAGSNTPLERLPPDHVAVLHGEARGGAVAVASTRSGRWRERVVPLRELGRYIAALPLGHDTYLSQARFTGPRSVAHLCSINSLWVDFDAYHAEGPYSPGETLWHVLQACSEDGTPPPSYVLATGRGLCGVWLHDVVPRQALARWKACENALFERFEGRWGADPKVRDAARMLRLAGSLNSRVDPARGVRCLYPRAGQPWRYDFDELADELLPVRREELRKRRGLRDRRNEEVRRWSASGSATRGRQDAGRLWGRRLDDLQRLRRMRHGGGPLPAGQRDRWLFIASCAIAWLALPEKMPREVWRLAQEALGGAWSREEVSSQMGAAVRKAQAAGRGEKVQWEGRRTDPRYRFRNDTIVQWLEVTPEERARLPSLRAASA